jgi:hypothetical protein
MSFFRGTTGLRILTGVIAAIVVVSFCGGFASSSDLVSSMMESRGSTGAIEGLVVTLKQSSTSPPSVTVSVKNTNPDPITVLRYDSPLDSLALQLGLLSITPDGASEPLDLPRVQIRRKWPPSSDALIEIAPGESAENEIVLKEPVISEEQLGSKASVQLKGRWTSVWSKPKADIDMSSWNDMPDVLSGDFASNNLVINVG